METDSQLGWFVGSVIGAEGLKIITEVGAKTLVENYEVQALVDIAILFSSCQKSYCFLGNREQGTGNREQVRVSVFLSTFLFVATYLGLLYYLK